MERMILIIMVVAAGLIGACSDNALTEANNEVTMVKPAETLVPDSGDKSFPTIKPDTLQKQVVTYGRNIDSIVAFAESLTGTPYKYASTDPFEGFDCSGFITYVFNHFGISVPRSSKDFENVGTEVSITDCRKGDLVLFTGTDSTERIIGHMGIVVASDSGHVKFIHSSSGKAMGVVTTDMNKYYEGRYVKTVRIF